MKTNILLVFGFCCSITIAKAQQNTLAAGESFSNSAGSVSYSIGQIDYNSYGNTMQISEGVQHVFSLQPEENSLAEQMGIHINVFPNPSNEILNIQLSEMVEQLQFTLYDAAGRKLEQAKILSENTSISVANYAAGLYIVQIYKNQQPIHAIQIIKN